LYLLSFGDRGDGTLWIVDDRFGFFCGSRHRAHEYLVRP
jgi:hypothetical protein